MILFLILFFLSNVFNQNINKSSNMLEELKIDTKFKSYTKLTEFILFEIFQTKTIGEKKCFGLITDQYHSIILNKKSIFKKSIKNNITYFLVKVKDNEDLYNPSLSTLKSLREIKKQSCQLYVILLNNDIQLIRLFKFGDKYRSIDTRANYIINYNARLFTNEHNYLWKRIINVYLLNEKIRKSKMVYEILTVPYPPPNHDQLIPKRINVWSNGNFLIKNKSVVFEEKTLNLNKANIHISFIEHVPAVVPVQTNSQKQNVSIIDSYIGVELQIIKELSNQLNFNANLYEIENKDEKWGSQQIDGTFNGLYGEIINGKSDVVLGDFHYSLFNLNLMDLSIPYDTQCLTFLTPEDLTDNSWQTLILPFGLFIWIGVIATLIISAMLFLALAKYQRLFNNFYLELNEKHEKPYQPLPWSSKKQITPKPKSYSSILATYYGMEIKNEGKVYEKAKGLFQFETLVNSYLYTYSMLLQVSLPQLPTGWSLRVLTGSYWLYAILIVACYRSSLTAILANPAPRVTVDTLEELAESPVKCGGWGEQAKDFFLSLDQNGVKVGEKFEHVSNISNVLDRIISGTFSYYENTLFLRALIAQKTFNQTDIDNKMVDENQEKEMMMKEKKENQKKLHIMRECIINMPISLGLQKNSPLKSAIDFYLRKFIENGLIEKWINEVKIKAHIININEKEEVKALVNLKKFSGAFVVLFVGYIFGSLAFIGEWIHWKYVIQKDPNYNKYSLVEYYQKNKHFKI